MRIMLKQLNHNYEADPNGSWPDFKVVGKDIILVFDLNYFIYEQFKEGDKGRIIFKDCLMYRVGDPNDEGFYGKNNNSAWKASTAEKLGWEIIQKSLKV